MKGRLRSLSAGTVRWGGQVVLFYSANHWRTSDYAVGAARCDTPLGLCRKAGLWPVLTSRGPFLGPGGASAYVDAAGALRLAFHAWDVPHTNYPLYPLCEKVGTCDSARRRLHVGRVELAGEPNGEIVVVTEEDDAAGGPSAPGYPLLAEDATICTRGGAAHYGEHVNARTRPVDLVATPTGNGYWLLYSRARSGRSATHPRSPATGSRSPTRPPPDPSADGIRRSASPAVGPAPIPRGAPIPPIPLR